MSVFNKYSLCKLYLCRYKHIDEARTHYGMTCTYAFLLPLIKIHIRH